MSLCHGREQSMIHVLCYPIPFIWRFRVTKLCKMIMKCARTTSDEINPYISYHHIIGNPLSFSSIPYICSVMWLLPSPQPTSAPHQTLNQQPDYTLQFAPLHFLFSAAQKTNPASFNL